MEGKSSQNSAMEPKLFQIPIEIYDNDLCTKLGKEKKKEILNLFTNFNNLCSREEFIEIKAELHYACREGDVDLIKIYLCETFETDSKDLKFKIDKTNQTASLFRVNEYFDQLIILRTVKHESTEYIITSISGLHQNINIIKFPEDSAVKTIYKDAFTYSNIKAIYFPSSLRELKEGWCCYTNNLKKIIVSPSNGQFKYIDNKYLIGKSDTNNDEFDILLFARRDIKEISIPSNIKIISSYAFYYCRNLNKVEIPSNSNLQMIESFAFSYSNIKEIFIPSKVTKICEHAFFYCQNLNKSVIPTNSNLQTIESKAFSYTNIKEIYFPSSLRELKEGWCFYASDLTKIIISPSNGQFKFIDDDYLIGKSDSNNDEFDILLFASRDIKRISIPSNIKIISSYAFHECKNLKKVEISTNSNLQMIESFAFSYSKIKEIFIPSKVTKICEYAFFNCLNLNKFEIPTNSNLQAIEPSAFSYSKIKEIFIPSKVLIICENAFAHCRNLTKVEIPTNSNLQIMREHAFYNCTNLTKVEIPANSNLQRIESQAFSFSNIKDFFIPSKVSTICDDAFYHCKNLQIIEISEESELELFPLSAFSGCSDIIIMIPTSLHFTKA